MDLILTLIIHLALRALLHKASSVMVKENVFRCRAHSCHSFEFSHCFSCQKWKLPCSHRTQKGLNVSPVWKPMCAGTYQPFPDSALQWYSSNENGRKPWILGTFCSLLHIALASPKITQAANESAVLKTEIGVSWRCGDQSESWYLPCNLPCSVGIFIKS